MKQIAVVAPTGQVLRVVESSVNPPQGEDPNYCVELTQWEGWPDAPHPGAELRVVSGELQWHDPRDLADQRADRWAAIKAHRQALDEVPVALRDFALDADSSSRMDLMGALMAMQATGQTSRLWRCADNVMRELSLSDLLTVGSAIAARRQQLIETSDVLYQQIQAAADAAALAAITWPQP